MEQIFFEGLSKRLEPENPGETGARMEYRYTLPEVTDISGQEGIDLEVTLLEEGTAELEVSLCPLLIARPEFFPAATARIRVMGKGGHHLEIPFKQFHFRQMVRAFLNYIDSVSVRLGCGVPVMVHKMGAGIMGDFGVRAKCLSGALDAGEWMEYPVMVSNDSEQKRLVNITQCKYGKECLPAEYEPYLLLAEKESREYTIKIFMTSGLPAGGLEKSRFLFVPDGDGGKARELVFSTVKKRSHPYLVLTQKQWEKRRRAIASGPKWYQAFDAEYGQVARDWEVPAASAREDCVYPSYVQNALFAAAVAWKITGGGRTAGKCFRFLRGLRMKKKGISPQKNHILNLLKQRANMRGGILKCTAHRMRAGCRRRSFLTALRFAMTCFMNLFHRRNTKKWKPACKVTCHLPRGV